MPSGRTTAICEASDGFILAPLLFLSVSDMCSMALDKLNCYLFADDTKMLYSN